MNKENLVLPACLIAALFVRIGVGALTKDKKDYETGIVCAKADSTIYLSPVDGTLVHRELDFRKMSADKMGIYENAEIGDTLVFYKPKHSVDLGKNEDFVLALRKAKREQMWLSKQKTKQR